MQIILKCINSYLDPIGIVLGLFGSVGALVAWYNTQKIKRNVKLEKERLDKPINILIVDKENEENKVMDLPGKLRRGDLTRAELLGYIGMIPIKKELKRTRFELRYPSTSRFFENLQLVQKGTKEDTLEIECTTEEYDQFDFKALNETQEKLNSSESGESTSS